MKRILFYRDYQQYTGGHQKVRDYIEHAATDKNLEVSLYLKQTKESANALNEPHLFSELSNVLYPDQYVPQDYDIVFLAGMDWQAYLAAIDRSHQSHSIINLIQHLRHADITHPLHQFLQYKAFRICVSESVKTAIEAFAYGRCVHVPMGHRIPAISSEKKYDLYILAKKRPAWGRAITTWAKAQGYRVLLHDQNTPRKDVYASMAASRVSLCLPNKQEGFYLPGIEAMALSDCAIVPDCVVNREYKKPKDNLIICKQDMIAVKRAIRRAFTFLGQACLNDYKARGKCTAQSYSLENERNAFLHILQTID